MPYSWPSHSSTSQCRLRPSWVCSFELLYSIEASTLRSYPPPGGISCPPSAPCPKNFSSTNTLGVASKLNLTLWYRHLSNLASLLEKKVSHFIRKIIKHTKKQKECYNEPPSCDSYQSFAIFISSPPSSTHGHTLERTVLFIVLPGHTAWNLAHSGYSKKSLLAGGMEDRWVCGWLDR